MIFSFPIFKEFTEQRRPLLIIPNKPSNSNLIGDFSSFLYLHEVNGSLSEKNFDFKCKINVSHFAPHSMSNNDAVGYLSVYLPDEFNEGNFRLDFRANKQYSDINGHKVLFGSVMIAAKLEKPLEDVSQFKGVKLSYKKIFTDERGEFHQLYGYNDDITINQFQDNLSFSKKNVIRGLHTQREMPQDKLVQVIQGKILDVIVDYRKEESTYKKYFAIELDKTKQLFVPKGFLHGFLSLEDNTIVHYKVSSPRIENLEIAIDPFDSDLGVDWRIEHRDAILSNKDLSGFKFKDYF